AAGEAALGIGDATGGGACGFSLEDHAGAHGFVGEGVDQDETAGEAVLAVRVEEQGALGFDGDHADGVELERARGLVLKRVDVDAVADLAHASLGDLGGLFDQVRAARLQRFLVHPYHSGIEAAAHVREVAGQGEHVAARDIDLVLQAEGDGHGCEGFGEFAIPGDDGFHAAGAAAGQHGDGVARVHDARGKGAGEAAEIQVGTDDVLHGEAQSGEIEVAGDGHGLEVFQEGGTAVPGGAPARVDDVIAIERADGNVDDVAGINLRGEGAEFLANGGEDVLTELHQVHLIDGDDEVGNAQQGGEEGVAAGLLQHAVARIDQDDGEVGAGGAGGHVARV